MTNPGVRRPTGPRPASIARSEPNARPDPLARPGGPASPVREPGAPRPAGATTGPVVPPSAVYSGGTTPLRAPMVGARAPTGTVRPSDLAPRPPFDGGPASTELYEAMHGGLFGAGTDEDRLFRAIDGKTPEQVRAIRSSYRDHYGRDLDADVESELSGTELTRAQALLRGNRAAGDADALFEAMDGAGTDEDKIFRTLEGKSPSDRAAIAREYQSRHGQSLDAALAGELSGTDLDRARALTRGDQAGAEAARLHAAMDGMGTDEATIHAALEGKTPAERAAIEAAYRRQYGTELRGALSSELGGADLVRAEANLDGDTARADAARIRTAVDGLGTDEAAIQATLEGKSDAERRAIADAYRQQTGRELRADVRDEMGGNDLSRTEALLDRGQLSDAERLHYAMDGAGTDEATIRQVIGGRSREDLDAIRADYRARYGRELDADLEGELSGREAFDARMDMRGRPTTPEEALARLEATRAYERDGILNAPGRLLMDAVNDHGANLDRDVARARGAYREAAADGTLDAAESARLSQLMGYGQSDVGTYREGKDAAADAVGTAGAIAASVAVTIGTAGTATPLVVTALGAAAAGGTARVALSGAIQGQGYGWEAAVTDGALGAIDGATTVIGGGAGRAAGGLAVQGTRGTARAAIARAGLTETDRLVEMTTAELLERNLARRVGVRALEGATDGLVGGGVGGGLGTAVRDGTWDDGLGEGLARVGEGALEGGVIGVGVGGTIGGATGLRRSSAFDMVDGSKVWIDRNNVGNSWRDWGSYGDQLDVNRVVDPQGRSVVLQGANGPQTMRVFGASSDREAARLAASVKRLEDIGAYEALPREIHVRTRVGQFVDARGRPAGEVGGLGGAGDSMIIVRSSARTRGAADHVIHHEVGHNLDAARNWISESPNTPFGNGASVSTYGAKNAAEDFAETHRVLVHDWERVLADPDRYIHHNGDIGQKYRWILENVYGRTVPPPTVP